MPIQFNDSNSIIHLVANDTSYIIQIKYGYLFHLYWGKKIKDTNVECLLRERGRPFSADAKVEQSVFSLDLLPNEYPSYGNTDMRNPAYQIQLENGATISNLKYKNHRIFDGKPTLQGLPATYVEKDEEAQTLEIEMVDDVTGLTAIFSYTAFEKYDAIVRSVRFVNKGSSDIKLLRALSVNVDFHRADFDVLHLPGAWARERAIVRTPLVQGMHSIESRRGASSHQHNPFIAILDKESDEYHGNVYGFSLVYSGNFAACAEVDQFNTTRVSMGINPFDFSWLLKAGESFQTPETILVYSSRGIGEMSYTYHKLYRNRLCRGKYRDQVRPILINNWEATYFDFNEDKILSIAKTAQEMGIELFVLDDGWFGKRDSDTYSLGDWFVDRNKLPNGLEDLANKINQLGMAFGLWFEPEMVSPDSDLYRAHPDWCIHVPDRTRSLSRSQLILDYSREEVCEAVIKMVSDILKSAPISYVKWDMNRHMTEIGSAALPPERQRETAHRYMLGLYKVMDRITAEFPDVLFESCSGGGGRFDPGMLYYMPQTWTSDDTDAVERLKIQYGTSIVYPASTIGVHVSAVPNHQVGRITSMEMRGHVAMSGNFGYELDISKLPNEEKDLIKKQVVEYQKIRQLVQQGRFYRLADPFKENQAAWMFVSEDQKSAFVAYFRVLGMPNQSLSRILLKGLNPDFDYIIEGSDEIFGGDMLMYAGLNVPILSGDFKSYVWRLTKN